MVRGGEIVRLMSSAIVLEGRARSIRLWDCTRRQGGILQSRVDWIGHFLGEGGSRFSSKVGISVSHKVRGGDLGKLGV